MNAKAVASRRNESGPLSWCLLAALLFGASTPASKPLLEHFNPLTLSGLLYLGAALAVLPWSLRGGVRRPARGSGRRLAGAVLFGGIVGPVLLLTALRTTAAGSVALWLNLETVATALLARLFFREHLGRLTWVSLALIVAASALLSPGTGGGPLAVGLVAGACLAWGLDNNLTAIIDQYSPAQITLAKGLVAGVVNTGLGLALSSDTIFVPAAGAALGIGALSYGASILLYVAGAQHLGATRSQLAFSTAPAWGLALAWIALRESVLPAQLVATALMALAIWLWSREQHSHRHRHERTTHSHWHRHDDGHHAHAHNEPVIPGQWHQHEHVHEPVEHEHPHRPDLHHRHEHLDGA